jgi:hypothetical protein
MESPSPRPSDLVHGPMASMLDEVGETRRHPRRPQCRSMRIRSFFALGSQFAPVIGPGKVRMSVWRTLWRDPPEDEDACYDQFSTCIALCGGGVTARGYGIAIGWLAGSPARKARAEEQTSGARASGTANEAVPQDGNRAAILEISSSKERP